MESSDDRARVLSSVQALYNRYGYRPYRMNKFEEYDLYARNKDFLISDSVITFTDRSDTRNTPTIATRTPNRQRRRQTEELAPTTININAQITPNRLNMVCDIAARLACVLPTDAAMFAVMVVPMFSPRTIAAPISNGIHPLLHITRVRAMVALDDWSTIVRIVPINTKISTEPNP